MKNSWQNKNEKELTLQIISDNLSVKTHLELLHWLQGDIQQFLPHDILISAWGDFSLGLIYLDIVALHPLLRTSNLSKENLAPKIIDLFNLWQSHHHKPLIMNIEDGSLNINESIKSIRVAGKSDISSITKMNTAILHGIKDTRGSDDCLYILLSESAIPREATTKLPVFLPFIDCSFRRIDQLVAKDAIQDSDKDAANLELSSRECEIMDLVNEGKTNEEVGNALDISIFTVKNHLQKIFKKLGAINRSQATFKYKKK